MSDTPEQVAAKWHRLDAMARTIRDDETRRIYLTAWRARFDRLIMNAGPVPDVPVYAVTPDGRPLAMPATSGVVADDGDYIWPDDDATSELKLIAIVERVERLISERDEIGADIKDVLAMAKAIGFDVGGIRKVIADRKVDPEKRQTLEASWALYRRVMGVEGPIDAAILPNLIDARAGASKVASPKIGDLRAQIALAQVGGV